MSAVTRVILYGVLFTSTRMLIGASSTLFLLSRGLSLEGVAFLKSLQALVILLTDLPMGYFADRYSRKLSVVLGVFFGALWLGATAYSPSIYWLYLGEAFNALSLAFFNGAFEALLVGSSRSICRDSSFEELFGAFSKYSFLFMTVAALVGGIGVRTDSALFWWVGAAILSLQTLASPLLLGDLPSSRSQETPRGQGGFQMLERDVRRLVHYIREQPKELTLLSGISILTGVYYQAFIQFWQPLIALVSGSVTVTFFYSLVFALILLAQSWSGKLAPLVGRYERAYPVVWVALLVNALILYIGVRYAVLPLSVLSVTLFFLLYRVASILISAGVHRYIHDNTRATYASLISTLLRIALILIMPLVGWMVQTFGVVSLAFLGGGIFLPLLFVQLGQNKQESTRREVSLPAR